MSKEKVRTDLLGVFAGDERVLVFTRSGMKWGNALDALLLHDMVPGYNEEDVHKLVVRAIQDDETVPREVVKAPRRQRGTAPTNEWQRRSYGYLLRRAGVTKDQYPLPALAVDAKRVIDQLRALPEKPRRDDRVGTDRQYAFVKVIENVLDLRSGISRGSSMAEMKTFISSNVEAFRKREALDRLRHDEFVSLRWQEAFSHRVELSDADAKAIADIEAFAAAGCSVAACGRGLVEVDESGLRIDDATIRKVWSLERSGRLPGIYWVGEDGEFEVIPVPDAMCRSLSGRSQHLLAARRLCLSSKEYWMCLDEMIERVMLGRRIKRSRARDLARRLLLKRWEATSASIHALRAEDEKAIMYGMREERRLRGRYRLDPEAFDAHDVADADGREETFEQMAPCDGENGLPA